MWLAFHFRYPFFSKVCTCHTIGKLFIRSTVSTIIYICVFSRKYPAIRNYHFNTSSSFLSLALSGYSGVGFSSYEMNKLRPAHQCPLNDVSWLQISNRKSAASEQTAALCDSSLWNTVMVVGFSECHSAATVIGIRLHTFIYIQSIWTRPSWECNLVFFPVQRRLVCLFVIWISLTVLPRLSLVGITEIHLHIDCYKASHVSCLGCMKAIWVANFKYTHVILYIIKIVLRYVNMD